MIKTAGPGHQTLFGKKRSVKRHVPYPLLYPDRWLQCRCFPLKNFPNFAEQLFYRKDFKGIFVELNLLKKKNVLFYNPYKISNHLSTLGGTLDKKMTHCVKSIQMRSFFWSIYFSIRTRKNSVFGNFLRIEYDLKPW